MRQGEELGSWRELTQGRPAKVWALEFISNAVRSHWTGGIREVTWSGFKVDKIRVAAGLRRSGGGHSGASVALRTDTQAVL